MGKSSTQTERPHTEAACRNQLRCRSVAVVDDNKLVAVGELQSEELQKAFVRRWVRCVHSCEHHGCARHEMMAKAHEVSQGPAASTRSFEMVERLRIASHAAVDGVDGVDGS